MDGSIVSRLTTEVENEIISSAARAFLQDAAEMRRIDGTVGLVPKNPQVGDLWSFDDDGRHYRFDGEHWVLI